MLLQQRVMQEGSKLPAHCCEHAAGQFAVPPAPLWTMEFGSRQFDVFIVAVGGLLQIVS